MRLVLLEVVELLRLLRLLLLVVVRHTPAVHGMLLLMVLLLLVMRRRGPCRGLDRHSGRRRHHGWVKPGEHGRVRLK